MPILLKLYRCSGHGLKMCMLCFVYNPQRLFVLLLIFILNLGTWAFDASGTNTYTFIPIFETFHAFVPWSKDVHLVFT